MDTRKADDGTDITILSGKDEVLEYLKANPDERIQQAKDGNHQGYGLTYSEKHPDYDFGAVLHASKDNVNKDLKSWSIAKKADLAAYLEAAPKSVWETYRVDKIDEICSKFGCHSGYVKELIKFLDERYAPLLAKAKEVVAKQADLLRKFGLTNEQVAEILGAKAIIAVSAEDEKNKRKIDKLNGTRAARAAAGKIEKAAA